jgi:hypothetical protein
LNDNAHLTRDDDLDSTRTFYKTQTVADLSDMCKTRVISVKPSNDTLCIKDDFIVAFLADDVSYSALPPQSPSVAGNSDSDSVMARPPHSTEHGNIEASEPSEPSQIVESEVQTNHDDSAGEDRNDFGSDFDGDKGWGSDDDDTIPQADTSKCLEIKRHV